MNRMALIVTGILLGMQALPASASCHYFSNAIGQEVAKCTDNSFGGSYQQSLVASRGFAACDTDRTGVTVCQ